MPFQKRPELRNPELLKRIYQLRNENSGFNNIAKIVSNEFNVDITHPTAKNLYYEYAATQNVKKQTGEKVDADFEKLLSDKFMRIEKITSSLLDAVETIKKDLTPELYLKHAPTIIAILRESLNQLSFIRNEQKEIIVKQENLIYSPIQVLQEINRIEEQKKDQVYVVGESVNSTEEVTSMADDEPEKPEEE